MIRQTLLAALLCSAGCKSLQPKPTEFIVSYDLTADVQISCDSVKYKNALGTVIKVTSPTLPWSVAYFAPPGTFAAGTAWMSATGSGQASKLKITWTLSGSTTHSDSSFGTTSAPGKFTLTVAKQL